MFLIILYVGFFESPPVFTSKMPHVVTPVSLLLGFLFSESATECRLHAKHSADKSAALKIGNTGDHNAK